MSQELTGRTHTLSGMTQTADLDTQQDLPGAPSGRPSFTITEAATACAVSRKTITRKLADLAEAGAAKDSDGIWRIPVEALLSVGLHPGRSLPPAQPRPVSATRSEPTLDLRASRPAAASDSEPVDTVTVSRDRWDDLRIRLARAEAESVERGRALEDARLALRALTAGPAAVEPQSLGGYGSGHRAGQSARLPNPAEEQAEAPEPAGVLPPTPVPTSLAADSSVWDTLLPTGPRGPATPRTASAPPATPAPPAVGSLMPLLTYPAGQPVAPQESVTVPGPGFEGSMVASQPRRKWWGGRK